MSDAREITGDLIVNTGFAEHDAIQGKIHALNIKLGLRTIMGGAWTYDRLAKNAASKLGLSYADAHRLGIDALIEQV
jgi:hypothetical protein